MALKKSRLIRTEPCPLCRQEGHDNHGDNLHIYADGSSWCYARHGGVDKPSESVYPKEYLKIYTKNTSRGITSKLDSLSNNSTISFEYNKNSLKESPKVNFTEEYKPWRGVSEQTYRTYKALTRVDESGRPYAITFPYGQTLQVRSLDAKNFSIEGDSSTANLFGMEAFAPGSAKAITVTEGAQDATSVYEMFGRKFPAVSVRSASSARGDCEKARDYLNSFERIYLAFDNDGPGQKALADVATLFDPNKIYHVKMEGKYKDANDYLQNKATEEFVKVWWASKPYLPKGIVADYDSIADILATEDGGSIASYPFSTLDSMAYGIRSGEIVLLTAQEKIGKTEIIRAIEAHLLRTTDYNIGIIHLEEKEKRSIEGLISYQVATPAHLPDCGLSKEDKLDAYKQLTKRDGRLHFYTHFGSDDPDVILDIIRKLVSVCHCKFIFLDHITMLVTGYEGDDERRKLDYISTRLAMLTRELDFTLFLVSHVNDEGKTRGSRNISKVADLLVALDRDIENDDPEIRNRTKVTVKGNRFASTSGPAGSLKFDPKTYQIKEEVRVGTDIEAPF